MNQRNIISIVFFLIALAGCDKGGKDEESIGNVADKVRIEVEAPQTDDWASGEIADTRASKSTDAVLNDKSSGLDMQLHTTGDASLADASTRSATTRWTNLDTNVRFRVVAYKCATTAAISTTNYAGYGDYQLLSTSVSTITPLILTPGIYTFVCYSYGKSDAMSSFDSQKAAISVSNGDDFMVCLKPGITISTYSSQFTLDNIVFQHQCVRYRITASAQSERMKNITACSATLTLPASTASYSFNSNTMTPGTTSGTSSMTWSSPNGMSVTSNYVYLLPQSSKNITISTNLTIGGKAFSNTIMALSNQTFNSNSTYKTTISFSTTEGYILGGTFWASGNLYYRNGAYSIYSSSLDFSGKTNSGEYWGWNMLTPDVTTTSKTWDDSRDPCRQVAPAGRWRLPTNNEAQALINTGYVCQCEVGITFGGILILPYAGQVSLLSGILGLLGLKTYGCYWVKGLSDSSLNYGYLNFTNGLLTGLSVDINYSYLMNYNLMSIRCVRQ